MPISGSILPVAGKAGYRITDDPYEPTSLFESQGGTSDDVSSDIVMFEMGNNANLVSGDTLSTLFGKIRYFIQNIGTRIGSIFLADATVDNNVGVPSCDVTKTVTNSSTTFHFAFHNLKGATGATGATGASGSDGRDGTDGRDGISPVVSATASVNNTVGTPNVRVTKGGTDAQPVFNFAFENLRGERGLSGSDGSDGEDGISPVVSADATVDGNSGTPSVDVTKTGTDAAPVFHFAFHNLKGQSGSNGTNGTDGSDGITPDITMQATVDNYSGTPSVQVNQSGTLAEPIYELEFHNLKGADGNNGRGVIAGGSTGEVLCKKSNADFDTEWINISGSILPIGGTTGQVLAKRSNADRDVEWKNVSSSSGVNSGDTTTLSNINSNSFTNEDIYSYDGNVEKNVYLEMQLKFRVTFDEGQTYTDLENEYYNTVAIPFKITGNINTGIYNSNVEYPMRFDFNFDNYGRKLNNIHGMFKITSQYDSINNKTILRINNGYVEDEVLMNSGGQFQYVQTEFKEIIVKGWCLD